MSKRASPAVIGAFVVTAVALAVASVLVLGGGRFLHKTAHVIVYFDGSIAGLKIGAPVKFRGIEIGMVKDIRINMTGAIRDPAHVRIPVLLEIDQDRLESQGVRSVNLDDHQEVERLVMLGLRAELATESLVTGIRYVALDIRPDTPVVLTNDHTYPEIPSVRGSREAIPEKANAVLTKLAEVDFDKLVDSMRATLDDLDRLLRSPHLARAMARVDEIAMDADLTLKAASQTARDLGGAIAELKRTAASTTNLVSPTGPLSYQLDSTLRDLRDAARSLRRLTDQLSRDPGAIVRGGRQ